MKQMDSPTFKKVLGTVCFFALTNLGLMAQAQDGSTPPSFSMPLLNNQNIYTSVDIAPPDMNIIDYEDASSNPMGDIPRVGVSVAADIDPTNTGHWTYLLNGGRIWSIKIKVPGAAAIGIYFDNFYIPNGAKLYAYTLDKTEIHGGFTSENNQSNNTFGISPVTGDEIIIEYFEPQSVTGQGVFHINELAYIYRNWDIYKDDNSNERDFGDSDPCEVNVNCSPEGTGKTQQRDAVCRILVKNGAAYGWCSGTLMNNTSQNCTRYFLTALHCGLTGGTLTSAADFNQWTFYFKYQAPTCTNPGTEGSLGANSLIGCTHVANANDGGGNTGSDFLLLTINNTIPASYNAFYAGWNRNNTAPTSGFGIHHPAGDIKKISTFTAAATSVSWGGTTPNTHWQVQWSATTNGHGVTEGGSSGSPLFNSAYQVVGTLTGGGSFCTATSAPDAYGKFYYHWDQNGAANNRRLKPWLDPGNTGVTSMAGVYAPCTTYPNDAGIESIFQPANNSTLCDSVIIPRVIIRNYGTSTLNTATIRYYLNANPFSTFAYAGPLAAGATDTVNLPAITVPTSGANFTFNAYTVNPNGVTDGNFSNDTSHATSQYSPTFNLPYAQAFETGSLPASIQVYNPNGDGFQWAYTNLASGNGVGTGSIRMDNFTGTSGANPGGTLDWFFLPDLNFSSLTSAQITFDVAYAPYSATASDSLIVAIATDCATLYNVIYFDGGTGINGNGATTSAFVPTAGQWDNKVINLTPYIGQDHVSIAFINVSDWGNYMYVDNINVTGVANTPPVASFTKSASTICAGQTITYTNTSVGATSFSWTFPGGTPSTGTTSPIVVTYPTAGTYTTTLTATNINGSSTTTQTVTVNALPTQTASNAGPYCVGQTIQLNATAGASDYDWTGPASYVMNNTQNPTRTGATTAMAGVYTCTITNAAGCSTTSTTTVVVNTLPTNTASNTGPYCAGATIQLNATAGASDYDWTGPASYVQNNTQNPTRTNCTVAMGGVYTVTITNASGCSATATTTVVVNALPTANATNGGPYCVGQTIQLNSVGGSATDDWAGPGGYTQPNTQNPTRTNCTVAMAGAYTVTVTNASGCTSTSSTTVVVNTLPTPTATNGGPYCVGQTIQLNSPTGSATDDWAGPGGYTQANTQNPTRTNCTVAMAGIYTVTVTNASSCSATATTTVVVNTNPTANATNTGAYCVGGTIQLNSVGGSATDDWTGPGGYVQNNTQNPTLLSATTAMAGVYTVTVTNASGCTATSTTTVVVNTLPTQTASNTGPYCIGATIQLNATGGASDYDWTGPGGYTQNNTQNPTRTGATLAMGGIYTCTITNAAGCSITSTTTVVVNTTPTAGASNGGPFCVGQTISLGSTGGGTYGWTGPLSFTSSAQNPTIPTATTGMAGVYTVTVTLGGGCTASATTTVVVNTLPTQTASNTGPYCAGQTINLNATAGASDYDWTGPLSFVQNNTQNTSIISSTIAMTGTYSCTITNAAGCSTTATTAVVVNALPSQTASNTGPYCNGATIQLNATAGATDYDWTGPSSYVMNNTQNPTIPGATIANSGTYTVTLTNAAGCTNTSTTVVSVTSASATANNTGPFCVGGTIGLTSTGGGTYAWTGPLSYTSSAQNPTIPTASVGMAGVYTVTVTLGGGCTASATTTVAVNTLPTQTASNTGPYCEGATINLNATAGASDYDWTGPGGYIQNNTQNPVIISSVPAMTGTYTVTLTNAAGCTTTSTTVVTVNSVPTQTASNTGPYCSGSTIQLNATAGASDYDWTGPASYVMNNTQNPSIVSSTIAMSGTYTVTLTNVSGCTATATTTVTVNSTPASTAGNTGPYCEGTPASLSSSGGGTYAWSGPGGFSDITQNPSLGISTLAMNGIYTVTVTLPGGCTSSATTTVVVNTVPTVSANASLNTICAGQSVTLSGSGANSYTWDNSVIDAVAFSPAGTNTYMVTGTALNGCTATATTTVTVNTLPTATANNNSPTCIGQPINLTSGGGIDFDWTGPSSFFVMDTQNPSIAAGALSNSGIYTVTVTDANGCMNTATTTVVVNSDPTPVASSNSPVCEGASLDLNATGGIDFDWVGPNSFSAANNQNPSVNPTVMASAGIYTVTVTDANGCSATATTSAIINPLPVIPTITQSGDTLFANPSSGFTYQWYMNGSILSGETSNFYVASTTANYSVEITNASPCTSSSSNYSYTSTLSVDENEGDHVSVSVYPNPTDGNFSITVSTDRFELCDIRIYNKLGQVVYQKNKVSASQFGGFIVDFSTMAVGTYTVMVYVNDQPYATKLVKK